MALNNQGFILTVFSPLDYVDGSKAHAFISQLPNGIKLIPLKRYGWRTYINRIIVIFRELNKTKYERIIVTGMFPLWIGALIKIIYRNHRHIDFFVHGSEINLSNSFKQRLTHWSLKKADIIWAVSGFTSSLLPESIKKNKRIEILPNGIHIKEWEIYKNETKFNWQGYPNLLSVGSISPRKGQHRVIKALPAIIKVFPEVQYHIVGLSNNSNKLNELITTLGVSEHVTIHGRLADNIELAKAYQTSDIFMMLSENQTNGEVEGFGIAILEANYFGIPAIGASGCGIEDAIKNEVTGELIDADNAIEITSAIKKILENKDMYKNNLNTWIQNHNWDSIVENFIIKK